MGFIYALYEISLVFFLLALDKFDLIYIVALWLVVFLLYLYTG